MGPILLFDKSTIQSLSASEALWLTHHYTSNITPVLFLEIMADLKVIPRDQRTPEQIVSGLADKFTPLNSYVNIHHFSLYLQELVLGHAVPMQRRVVIGGGRKFVDKTGKTHLFFDESPEDEAFRRWQDGDFDALERHVAAQWRASLTNIDSAAVAAQWHQEVAGKYPSLTDLQSARAALDIVCSGVRNRYTTLRSLMDSLGIPERSRQTISTRWKKLGGPPVVEFAPFATWCFRVNILTELAIIYKLVRKPFGPKNSIDRQYLYYLPFCQVFSSNDVFHKTLAPLFLAKDQSFVHGEDLKRDLAKIDDAWRVIPPEIKAKGSLNYAVYPPRNPELLTYQLWDRHVGGGWKRHAEDPIEITPEIQAKVWKV